MGGPYWDHSGLFFAMRVHEHEWQGGGGGVVAGAGESRVPLGKLEVWADRKGGLVLNVAGAHFAQEVIAADKVPVPGLHTQCLRGSLLHFKLERFVPTWVA